MVAPVKLFNFLYPSLWVSHTRVVKMNKYILVILLCFCSSALAETKRSTEQIYQEAIGIMMSDEEQALKLFGQAAENGHALSQFQIGRINDWNKSNFTLARQYYELSANQGIAIAQLHLGSLYKDGKGVPQDFSKAYVWGYVSKLNNGPSVGDRMLSVLSTQLTSKDVLDLQKIAHECIRSNYKKCL
ncbi:Sel1 repeat protein [Vibrio chagasii]|nr:Sel1 repeat protein [Vibrio chagasii]